MKYNPEIKKSDTYFAEDHHDEPYFHILMSLPPSLRPRHVKVIEESNLNTEQATAYLSEVIKTRQEALTETHLSDPRLEKLATEPTVRALLLKQLESTVLQSPTIGEGQTAKIKRWQISDPSSNERFDLAVKYLLTPTAKTLSVVAEHDMLKEVERMQEIEAREQAAHVDRVRVPHPYLHHQNEQIQCYAMEHVNGADLRQVLEAEAPDSLTEILARTYETKETEEALYLEFEKFLLSMHEYCLHGDIKPANLMVNTDGVFYLIDFGQSVLTQDIDDKGREQFDNLKELEVEQIKTALRLFFRHLSHYRASHPPQKS